MAASSSYLQSLFLNFLRGAAPTAPTGLYLSLHTADPGVTGASEVSTSGTGYARQALTFGAATNPSAGIGQIANTNSLTQTFTAAVGPVTYLGVWDAASAGNFLRGFPVTTSKTYASGDTETVAVGAIVLSQTS